MPKSPCGRSGEAGDLPRESRWDEAERERVAGLRGSGGEAQPDARRADSRADLG